MSEFKRPVGVSDDPEHCYRSGYQHGAWALFEFLGNKISVSDQERLRVWIESDLQHWRHDRKAAPRPPSP